MSDKPATRKENEIIDFNKSHDKLLTTVDKFIGRIDNYETEQIARDSQFNKLLAWAQKVSKQTGIPLEYL
jgi:septal ring factor EnvC (AmiA/AmiB activator)